jgi:uncharacterized oligopeptide transporter (OPT) family protein
MAIPLKRQMIQVEQLRFPANVPTGETLRVMYSHGGDAMKKALSLGLAGLFGVIVAALRDALGWIPGLFNLPWRIKGIAMAKLTLSFEPSLIFIGIGAICGIKVGLSMLLGLVINYAVLAPIMIHEKDIQHAPPVIQGDTAPRMPLEMKAGQSFSLQLEEAVSQPELPSPEAMKANPALASEVSTTVARYTWERPTSYRTLDELIRDLNAPTLENGTANPFKAVVEFAKKRDVDLGADVLCIEAPKARNWEARLSIPEGQKELVRSLGLSLPPDADDALVKRVEARAAKASPTVGTFRNISLWSLWPGATILVVGGLLALAFQWRSMGRTFASIFTSFSGMRGAEKGPLDDIEIPMSWFAIGFPATGLIAVALLVWIFSIPWWMGLIAVVMTFFLGAVTARAGAEIGMNPIGAMGKVTQLTYGAISPGNVQTNLMTAGVTAGAVCSCSDTVGNLKVGHMVGASPRKQFISQLFGILAGAMLAVPVYFILVPDVNALGGDKYPAPSALVWMGVAKVLSQGIHTLPHSAVVAVIVAFIAGVVIVVVDRYFPKLKPYTPSPAALGMSMTMPGYTAFAIFLGAAIAWILEKKAPKFADMYTIPVASGWIAGESIMAVVVAGLNAFNVI